MLAGATSGCEDGRRLLESHARQLGKPGCLFFGGVGETRSGALPCGLEARVTKHLAPSCLTRPRLAPSRRCCRRRGGMPATLRSMRSGRSRVDYTGAMFSSRLTYAAADTPVSRCDARVKLVVLLAVSIALFVVQSWIGIAILAIGVFVLAAVARISPSVMNSMLVPVYVLAGFSVVFAVIAQPSSGGLLQGLFLGVRMIALVAASFVVCLTSASSDLLDAFAWFLGPLRKLRVPVDDIAFTLALSLRFIPLVELELRRIRQAQIARGAESAGSLKRNLSIWASAFSALFIGMFRHADTLADAMDARCYGAAPVRTRLPK